MFDFCSVQFASQGRRKLIEFEKVISLIIIIARVKTTSDKSYHFYLAGHPFVDEVSLLVVTPSGIFFSITDYLFHFG